MNVLQIFPLKEKERCIETKFLPIYNSNTLYAMNINSKACTTLSIYTVSIHRMKHIDMITLKGFISQHHKMYSNHCHVFWVWTEVTLWNQGHFVTQMTRFYKFTLFTTAIVGDQGELTWRSSRANITSPSQTPTSPSSGGPC